MRELTFGGYVLRAQSVLAAGVLLLAGAFLIPACSTATDDTPGCTNATKDEGELGVDCGGICPAQCTGAGCTGPEQCASGKCENGVCGAPAGKTCGVGTATQCNDGEKCELDKDCTSGFCNGSTCAVPPEGSHSNGAKDSGETGIDCGGSVKATQPCPDGQGCTDNTDCVGTCENLVCGPIGPKDGKKNQGETDVDCGGPTAPKCANGKDCAANSDCADDYCPDATKKCTAPTYTDGVQNGTETDLDCGGTGAGMKKCAQGLNCKVDGDCNGACNYATKCVDMPSCKRNHGGDTCGGGDVGNGQNATHATAADPAAPGHEDCCRTIEVKGYTDPIMPPGTTKVYVDKYEITAGRLRAFLEAIGGGSVPVLPAGSTNAKPANIKNYMATHRPSRWNPGWENALPVDNTSSQATYVVKDPTTDLLYPGQDRYLANFPTQSTWWIRATGPTDTATQTAGQQGTYTIETGVFSLLTNSNSFPEFYANPAFWAQGEAYAVGHANNCSNEHGAYGWATYWFDDTTIKTYGGDPAKVGGKAFPEALLDEKSLNCTPFALFAAFCAWDGGQLASAEVIDAITGNTVEPVYSTASQNGKLAAGKSYCGLTSGAPTDGNPGTLNTFSDGGTQACYGVQYYPSVNENLPIGQRDFDDSGKIAAPGRVAADTIRMNAGDEPWMDLIGNLEEAVLKRGETERFDYRGYGVEYGSITHHRLQESTPRMKGGPFGARCMRFK
ncbi:hypothetical protein BH11MYX4_BH11MYX4_12220 [soil metagenome]